MKILNLYAGIGGNRLLWGNSHEITAVEINPEIANEYQRRFPTDTVIIADAHQYLIDHVLDGWDFIWASPPCPSHSKLNTDGNQKPKNPEMTLYQEIIMLSNSWYTDGNQKPKNPEMTLYQEIIMLSNSWYKGKWVVENVISHYEPLIAPTIQIARHFFWCNYYVNKTQVKPEKPLTQQTGSNERFGFDLKNVKINANKKQILRNLVDPEVGLHFFNRAFEIVSEQNMSQQKLFDV